MTVKTFYRFLLATVLAAALHVLLGWEWTALAGLVAGFWIGGKGFLFGAAVVALDYLGFVAYSFLVNPGPVTTMTETMGGFLGNMPSFVVVALTVLIGVLVGALSGAAGSQLRKLTEHRRKPKQMA